MGKLFMIKLNLTDKQFFKFNQVFDLIMIILLLIGLILHLVTIIEN